MIEDGGEDSMEKGEGEDKMGVGKVSTINYQVTAETEETAVGPGNEGVGVKRYFISNYQVMAEEEKKKQRAGSIPPGLCTADELGVNVKVQWRSSAGLEEMEAEAGDDGGVVEAEVEGREMDGAALAGGGFEETGAQTGVGGDASADGDGGTGVATGGAEGLLHEDVDDGLLERGDDVGNLLGGQGSSFRPPSLSPDRSGASYGEIGRAHV
jgi:hypothetical protein